MRKNTGGFTLVETVVVCAAIAIVLAGAVISITEYSRHARFKRENEYAKTLFAAAQAQLTKYSRMGTLGELAEICAGAEVPLQSLQYDGGGESTDAQRYYLMAEQGAYTRYLDGTLEDTQATALFDLLDAYVYQKQLLDAAICVELHPVEGVVYAVLYSDSATAFSYGAQQSGTTDICQRTSAARKAHMLGYYGIAALTG